MQKMYWKPLRIFLLALTFSSVLVVVGKSLLYSNPDKGPSADFSFPPDIPLTEWQPLESDSLPVQNTSNLISARVYRYQHQQNKFSLDIEMRYVIDTDGDIKTMLNKHLNSETYPGKLTIHHQEGIGFYGLAATTERAYLSSCINPYGGSTVTAEQFRNNRNTYDLQVSRLVPWLLGQQELRDFRCLWTVLSMPLEDTTAEQAYPVLEKAWVSWYAWWQPRFPDP
ncbi:cyanoexosortase A system-associated protein [Laspinema sp. D1]|uniref:Cyanoexosortase A system-associated protein n=2 Tax=Laspinema TaxID=2584823 RepID=A0ABT2MUZ0_9CYAN|nr:cyanoexosortase A system-associated protein [Laspinema sp. D2a]